MQFSKRSVLIVVIINVLMLCGTAVAFYFIGLYMRTCESISTPRDNVSDRNTKETMPGDGRLPRHIEPILYKIELFPNIYGENSSAFSFSGSVWLRFKCIEQGRNITLNVNKLDLVENSMVVGQIGTAEGSAIEILRYEIIEKWQFLIIYLDEALQSGLEYYVTIKFTGRLQTDFAGMYLSTYAYRTNNKYLAASQFSPTDARKAFPCLDEPDRKAQFEITLVRRKDMASLSNMPQLYTESREANFVADVYQRTPNMSTYLLAMAVGDLVSITRPARNGLNYTSWSGNETIDKTEHALLFGANVLSFFENYFDIPFPLPKQDILAVPETSVGAMENWGLIIFNQNRIFYKEGEYSVHNQMESTITISHEIVHQWFGNLVTMNWWSDLMLKEGFAVYFADVGIANVYPDWNFMNQFAVRNMHEVFNVDGLVTSHPVYKILSDTTEIRQVFDSISYTKGGCMIRMLNFILGDTDFQAGLKRYLQQFAYKNVDHNDLWMAVEPKPLTYYHPPGVKAVMDTWILQKNYPIITIRQMKPGVLKVTQERFLNNPSEAGNDTDVSPFDYIWKIPLTYTTNSNTSFSVTYEDIVWLEDRESIIIDRQLEDLMSSGNWIVANLGQYGYYRVNYDETVWVHLITQLKMNKTKIHLVNRAQIINDLFSLSKANIIELKLALSVFEYLMYEDEYVPWLAVVEEINHINRLIIRTNFIEQFQSAIRFLIKTTYKNLEINSQTLTMEQKLLQSTIFSLASSINMSACIDQSKNDFTEWNKNGVPLEPNLRDTILCSALKFGPESDWNFVLLQYNSTININEKYAYLHALTCTTDEVLQDRLLNLTGDPATVQSREVVSVLRWLAENPTAVGKAWKHVKENWQWFLDTFSGSLFLLNNLITGVTGSFTTKEQLDDIEHFIAVTSDLGSAKQAFHQSVETLKSNIRWLSQHEATVENWTIEMATNYAL